MLSLAPSLQVSKNSELRLAAGSRRRLWAACGMAVCWHPPPLLESSLCWPSRGGLLLQPPFNMHRASRCFENLLLPAPHSSCGFLCALTILSALLGPQLVSHRHLCMPENFSRAPPLPAVWQVHLTVQGPWLRGSKTFLTGTQTTNAKC